MPEHQSPRQVPHAPLRARGAKPDLPPASARAPAFPNPGQKGRHPVMDANGVCLAHVYGQPSGAIAVSDNRLTNNEAQCISKLISRLPSWWRMEEPNKAGSRSKRFVRMNPL